MPAGLQLSSSGLISGTPTATGDFSFTVRVTDGIRSATHAYTLTVVPKLKIAPVTVAGGEVSVPFEVHPAAAGGKSAYRWSASGLPAGVSIDPATGALTGRPSLAGSFPVKLTVTDSLGFTDSLDVTLTFAPKVTLADRALRGKVGRAFTARLTASGGVEPRTWSLVRGKVPAGVRFSRGVLSGTPRKAGKVSLVVQVTDKLGAVARATLVLNVKA